MKRFNFKNMMNMRDLGGYPTLSGGYTCYDRFIRSDLPVDLTDEEVRILLRKGITTVVDLRTGEEVAGRPCCLAEADGFAYHRCPLYEVEHIPENESDMGPSYLTTVGNHHAVYRVMKVFAKAKGGVLFHCSAGKDRTGLTAALLLSLADAPAVDIIADYQVSGTYIRELICRFHEENPEAADWTGQSKPEYMERFLMLFSEKYGSVMSYLMTIGLNETEIQKIRNKLTSCSC